MPTMAGGPTTSTGFWPHETGHIFSCPDEYAAAGCICTSTHGIDDEPNANCATCAPGGGIQCLMKNNDWAMCSHTRRHLGWGLTTTRVPQGAPVYAVSRSRDKLDIFFTDRDGRVMSAAWEPSMPVWWRGFWHINGGMAAAGAPVTAVVRSPDHLDLFATGTDGIIRAPPPGHRTTPTAGTAWWPIRDGRAAPGSTGHRRLPTHRPPRHLRHRNRRTRLDRRLEPVQHRRLARLVADRRPARPDAHPHHAVVRSPDHLDLFATGTDGIIRTAAWAPDHTDGWHGWWPIRDGRAAPGAPVTAVSRRTDHLDIFVTGTDGRVWTAAWNPSNTDGWHGWWPIRDLHVPMRTPINAVVRSPDHLDLFATGTDGIIRTAAWAPDHTDGWHGWWPIRDGRAAPGAPVTAVSRRTDHLDIFVTGTDGRVWTAAWNPSNTDGWHGWWPMGA